MSGVPRKCLTFKFGAESERAKGDTQLPVCVCVCAWGRRYGAGRVTMSDDSKVRMPGRKTGVNCKEICMKEES